MGSIQDGRETVTAQRSRPKRDAAPLAAGIALAGFLALATVWALQARGYSPCELCLRERIPFYAGVPVAAALAISAPWLPLPVLRLGLALLALAFAGGAALGAYHAGVEWGLWAGPTGCSGVAATPGDVGDFLKRLDDVVVVRCDEAALRVLGLSLAAWNAVLSAALAATAIVGCRRAWG